MLSPNFVLVPRGPISVKGVGEVETWLLKKERAPDANEGAVPA
jgi:hypothetical protein